MPAGEVFGLADDLMGSSTRAGSALYGVFADETQAFADDWRDNAKATSGAHARFYPNAITREMKVGASVVADVGPEMDRKQGFLGRILEFGGERSPAHLDGARALPAAERRLEKAAADAIDRLLP